MRQYSTRIAGGTLTRINKATARKLYESGKEVFFCPCNLNPLSPWGLGIWEHPADWGNNGQRFDDIVTAYTWYNCNSETGRYVAFYVMA